MITADKIQKILELYDAGLSVARISQELNSHDWQVSFWLENESMAVISGIYREGGDDNDVIEFLKKSGFDDAEDLFKRLMEVDTFRINRFKGQEWVDYVVENSLYMLAKGYYVEEWKETMYDGEVKRLYSKRYVQSSNQATIKWLEQRKQERWRAMVNSVSESEASTKRIENELKTFGLTTAINKLRKMYPKKAEYGEEEYLNYEHMYLGEHYDDLIELVYTDIPTETLVKNLVNGV